MTNNINQNEEIDAGQKIIDQAIEDCRMNIVRHSNAPVMEVIVGLLLAGLIIAGLLQVSKLELESRSQNYFTIRSEVEAVRYERNKLSEEMARLQKIVADHQVMSSSQKSDFADLNKQLAKVNNEISQKQNALTEGIKSYSERPLLSDHMLYGGGAIVVLIIALLGGTYRLHLREIAKNEQYKLAFHRIRIAANNAQSPGFDSEVRAALTQDAFDVHIEERTIFQRKKIESPLPGLPSSDLATSIVNRLLDEVHIVFQPKEKPARK
ncbi:hypothetical protein EBAPG3_011135 [Nitrosospira lacus]|uniref:Uncharacterized protein n=1 Tax=Nitrosospira lacus TaxID=1288494 RepID=A0A1W6SR70_9PROT|nr:hypothetical protein [Nitrosospira lacus]ARO88286.1 hypothetical protein EBAPG3_011135 [Nitrosospira lacus]